jgi:hypothetical protein
MMRVLSKAKTPRIGGVMHTFVSMRGSLGFLLDSAVHQVCTNHTYSLHWG